MNFHHQRPVFGMCGGMMTIERRAFPHRQRGNMDSSLSVRAVEQRCLHLFAQERDSRPFKAGLMQRSGSLFSFFLNNSVGPLCRDKTLKCTCQLAPGYKDTLSSDRNRPERSHSMAVYLNMGQGRTFSLRGQGRSKA